MSSHAAADVSMVAAVQLPPMTERSAPCIVIMRYLQAGESVDNEMFISLRHGTFSPRVVAAVVAKLLFLCKTFLHCIVQNK